MIANRHALLVILTLALTGGMLAAESDAELMPSYPLWDHAETVAAYAKRVNLPPTRSLDLGNGVSLELALIPAGQFVMGTPPPAEVDEAAYQRKIMIGKALTFVSGGTLMLMLAFVLLRALRDRQRPQVSLRVLLFLTVAAGGCVLSGLHWRQSARDLEQALNEYPLAVSRFIAADQFEKPAHLVTLSHPFYMGKCAVSQEEYYRLIGSNPSGFQASMDNPVEQVSWDKAQAYCQKLSEQSGQNVRLPTEAEWEFSCRAGTSTSFHSGDTEADLDRVAWYERNSKNMSHPCGLKEANFFGLKDMHGNTWQWCQDRYGDYPSGCVIDPQGPAEGEFRVLRGGSWYMRPNGCRAAARFRYYPDLRYFYGGAGFRIVMDIWTVPSQK